MSVAIEFNNVSKLYRLGLVSSGTLSNDLKRWWQMSVLGKEDPFMKVGSVNDRSKAADSEYVWALKDIDFKVEQGDVVGIIGKNGAGKSTLLKLLSKVTGPTTGTIKAKGRIASLLEVGTGFHSELTGRENIYMNGAILGMTKKEINSKIDEIVDFSGCERYIDTPVKRYSSGMTVRLGFAVAAHLDPEILVVDEVLAVGDAEFQKKAIGKMQDVSRGEGRTVLFVSHNMASIRALCKTGVLLECGSVKYTGQVDDVVDEYMKVESDALELPISEKPRESGCSGKFRFTDIQFLDFQDKVISPHTGHPLRIRLTVDVKGNGYDNCTASITVSDNLAHSLIIYPSFLASKPFSLSKGKHVIDCDIPKLPLTGGSYRLTLFGAVDGNSADQIVRAVRLDVTDDDFFSYGRNLTPNLRGKVMLNEHSWNLLS